MGLINIVQNLLNSSVQDPIFFVSYNNIGRGLNGSYNNNEANIEKTKEVKVWRILNDELKELEVKLAGVFFSEETYVIQWDFELRIDDARETETLVYYWRGEKAVKGISPLPPHLDEHTPVERIWQWSEPAIFFHIFPKSMTVFAGKTDDFYSTSPHLFIVLGELELEVHLFEIPAFKRNLRGKGVFLLVHPPSKRFIYWYGKAAHNSMKDFKLHESLEFYVNTWKNFKVEKLEEGNENNIFLRSLNGELEDYYKLDISPTLSYISPRLFYLNSISGEFSANEILYQLRQKGVEATFPFTQNHLYSAKKPALFLLDNASNIWLWESSLPTDYDVELHQQELQLGKELAKLYVKEKEKYFSDSKIEIKRAVAGSEPTEFTNVFPVWEKINV